jgi:hypothetical protein
MSNGVKVSITKMMIASAPARRREADHALKVPAGEVRFIAAVHLARSAVAPLCYRSGFLIRSTFAEENARTNVTTQWRWGKSRIARRDPVAAAPDTQDANGGHATRPKLGACGRGKVRWETPVAKLGRVPSQGPVASSPVSISRRPSKVVAAPVQNRCVCSTIASIAMRHVLLAAISTRLSGCRPFDISNVRPSHE